MQRLSFSLLAMLAGLPIHSLAGPDDSDDPGRLETMVVTAHRTAVPLVEAGSSISVVDEEQIRRRQQVFAADLLRDLPGVALSRTAGNGSITQLRIRGAEANHLLVVIDGVEVNDPASGDEFNFAALTNYDIESMELIRGPQSALWGSDAMAGVLHITTRSARTPLSASGFLEGGSFGTLSAGGQLGTASARGSLTFNASRYETAGTSAALAGSEKDGYENTTVGLKGHYEFSEAFRAGFNSRYTEDSVEFDGFENGLPVDADNESDKEQLLLGVDADLELLHGRWQNTLRLTWLDTENVTSGDFPSTFAAQKAGVYLQGSFLLGGGENPDRHRLTLALDYEDEEYRQRTAFADQDLSLENTGLVAEFRTRPTDRLNLSASIRYDDNSEFRSVTTWRITGAYRPGEAGTRLHASAGTGQKRPSFTERFGFSPDFFIGNPDLKPEKNEGFEIGIEQPIWRERARIGATYFNERLKDEIQLTGFPSTPVNLDDRSKRRGVELELSADLTDSLSLTANYTYTDSTQPGAAPGSSDREIRRPRHQGVVNVNQAFVNGRGNLNLNVSYTGRQTDTVFTFPVRTVTLSAYTLVNVTAEWAVADGITLFGRAEDLFDGEPQDVFGFQSPGRGLYLGVRLKNGS